MNTPAGPIRFGRSILPLAVLAACAGQVDDQALTACPPTQIAVPSDRIGNANEAGEIRFVATMDDLVSGCRQRDDDIEVDIAFTMNAERGPAFDDEPVRLSYFIATVDPEREIADKQVLDVEIDFAPDQPASALREAVTIRLPVSTDASGANYSLYLGFQPDRQPAP